LAASAAGSVLTAMVRTARTARRAEAERSAGVVRARVRAAVASDIGTEGHREKKRCQAFSRKLSPQIVA